MRAWLLHKAVHPMAPMCAVSVVLTSSTVLTDSIGIEPEHAAVLAAELRHLIEQLEAPVVHRAVSATVTSIARPRRPLAAKCWPA